MAGDADREAPESEFPDSTIREELQRLADDPAGADSRIAVCETVGRGLARLGQVLWVMGYIVGPDRVSGASPFQFGRDAVVGVATVAQIGGELANGAVALLHAGNRYAAAALIRQLVEVEYLAHAFEEQNETAADWLGADRDERLNFWTPTKLRKRAGDKFLPTDYWHHCDHGGHPTTVGRSLLPDHAGINPAYLWADLAGHLVRTWCPVRDATQRLIGGPIAEDWALPDIDGAIETWRATDGLRAAMQDLVTALRRG